MMKVLEPVCQPRQVLSFDFDGTLHDPASEPPVPTGLFDRLQELRHSQHACWGINTGRSLEHLMEGLEESRFPFLPDWVVAREREIYFPNADGAWEAHESWNERCTQQIAALFDEQQLFLSTIRRELEERTGAQWLAFPGEPAGVISRTEEEMEWIVSRVLELVDPASDLSWQRNTIYLRFGHRGYHKGSSLAEVARILGVAAERCLAVGDSHNDVEMLDGRYARMVACPSNAIGEVQNVVRKVGGLVAPGAHGHAVIEALDHFLGH